MLQGFARDDERLALVKGARAAGVLVCAECQHVDFDLQADGVANVLRAVDIFVPNATEAMELTGRRDASSALDRLAQYARTVVIKCGFDGAIALHEGRRYAVPAPKVSVVDTTGAGDSFNAGLVYGLLRHVPFERALLFAVTCGSLSTTDYGGRALPRETAFLARSAAHEKEMRAKT
jgi:sugar/nucleoside kinase (ribokinase family)